MSIFEFWPTLLKGIGATLTITFASFAIGLVLAIPIAAARRTRFALVRGLATGYVELLRGVPPLTWIFIIFFGLPEFGIKLNPLSSSIVVFALISAAYLAEIYRAGLRAVPRGQTETGTALGLNTWHIYLRIVTPQMFRTVLPLSIAFLIGLLKDSAISSVIGVLDITGRALILNRQTGEGLTVFISAAALYLAMSIPIGLFGRWVSQRLKLSTVRV